MLSEIFGSEIIRKFLVRKKIVGNYSEIIRKLLWVRKNVRKKNAIFLEISKNSGKLHERKLNNLEKHSRRLIFAKMLEKFQVFSRNF